MAKADYDPVPKGEVGVPRETYFHVRADPEAFAAFGRGVERAGQAVEQVGEQWGETQLNAQIIKALKDGDAAVEDHEKLEGQAAVDDEQPTRNKIANIVQTYRSGLTGNLQNKYDQRMRAYEARIWDGKITTHAVREGKQVQKDINDDLTRQGTSTIAAGWDNDETFEAGRELMWRGNDGYMKARGWVAPDGRVLNQDLYESRHREVDAAAYAVRAESIFAHNKQAGMKFIQDHEKELSQHVDAQGQTPFQRLSHQFKEASEREEDELRGQREHDENQGPPKPKAPYTPVPPKAPISSTPRRPIDELAKPPPAPAPGPASGALPYSAETRIADVINDDAQQAITTALHGNERLGGLIAEAGAEYGVDPVILAKQTYQESGGRRGVVSSAGAAGVSQFMPGTARLYGVDVTDDRSSIRGQAHYMADMLQRFKGNTGLALAGYNWSDAKVARWLAGARISPPAETRNYVKIITGRSLASWRKEYDLGR